MNLKLGIVNFLTLIRIVGTIILIPLYNLYGGKVVGITSFFCYLTDSIDGILARKWKVSTFFGALFDGLADKLFTIINFIVLFLITPYAIIPIIIELLIIIVQAIKFSRNLNIQANVVGKLKVWILAASVVLTFFVSDISNIGIVPMTLKSYLLNIPNNRLYLYMLLPALIMEAITLISYIIELFFPKKNMKILTEKVKKIKSPKLTFEEKKNYFKNVWLSPEFYQKHKDETNLRDLRKLSKKS